MKNILCSISMSVFFISSLAIADTNEKYQLELSISKQYEYLTFVTYTNKSNIPHCIRSNEFEFRALGDFLKIKNESGKNLRYIGPNNNPRDIVYPDAYKIVLPGTSVRSPFYINKFYKMKGKAFYLSYAFPVISCNVVMSRYITMPPPSLVKYENFNPEDYKSTYSDWLDGGFVAVSNMLELKKDQN